MARPKRTSGERLADLPLIESLSLRGYNQKEIADYIAANRRYSITRQMVSYDLIDIQAKWEQEAGVNIKMERGKIKRHLELLIKTASDAWQSSIRTDVETIQEGVMLNGQPTGAIKEIKKIKDEIGDPRFLAELRALVKQYTDLFGLDEVKRLDIMSDGEALKQAITIYIPNNGRDDTNWTE